MTDEKLDYLNDLLNRISELKRFIDFLSKRNVSPDFINRLDLQKPNRIELSYRYCNSFSTNSYEYVNISFPTIEELQKKLSILEDEFIKA